MKHEKITLPEKHDDYPSLWLSDCKAYRLIRCVDDIQYILQTNNTVYRRDLSYHMFYESLITRWSNIGLPEVAPE